MQPTEARRTVEALAQGVDPETGEILPQDSLLQRPIVIRALFCASQALSAVERKKKQADDPQSSNAGSAWTEEEDRRLLEAFDKGAAIDQLAHAHGRSKGGIASRLVRLGRINERSDIYTRGAAAEPRASS